MNALYGLTGAGVSSGRDGLVLEANDEMLRMVGLSRDALAGGVPWLELIPPERRERAALVMDQLHRGEEVVALREVLHSSGRRVPVLVAMVALESDADAWVAVVVDLSDDRRMDHLILSEAAIVATLLDDAPIAFAFIRPDLRFVRVNRELATMTGLPVDDHVGRPVFDVVPDLREAAEGPLREVLGTGQPQRDLELEVTTAADPGATHTWLVSLFPIHAPNGTVLGVAAIAREQTELRRLQVELVGASQRQRGALQQLQHGLLPSELPCPDGYQLTVRYLAAEHEVSLGGDWYDAMVTPDGRLVVSVGDIAGHGLEAVGLMARSSAAIEAYTFEGYGPAATLSHLNSLLHLAAATSQLSLATAVIASVDPATGSVEYARAGHPYPVVRAADGSVRTLTDATGAMLGIMEGESFIAGRTVLEPGSTLLLFTDGLIERRSEPIDVGMARLTGALAGDGHERTQDDLVSDIVRICLGDSERRDDACLLAVHRVAATAAPGPAVDSAPGPAATAAPGPAVDSAPPSSTG